MLGGFMARLGIGAASVDAKLGKNSYQPGETATGEVVVRGGKVAQEVEFIKLQVCSEYKSDDNRLTFVLGESQVSERFTAQPGQTQHLEFTLQIPWETPLSLHRTPVWVATAAAISAAVDPKDRDPLTITPNPLQQSVLDALSSLGFRLKSSSYEMESHRYRRPVQELEFSPGGEFRGLNELEIVMFPGPDTLEVLVEADRKARGMTALFTSETEARGMVTLRSSDLGQVQNLLLHKIRSLS